MNYNAFYAADDDTMNRSSFDVPGEGHKKHVFFIVTGFHDASMLKK
jgi:hypothetical protein